MATVVKNLNQFAKTLSKELNSMTDDVCQDVKGAIKEVTKQLKRDIKDNAVSQGIHFSKDDKYLKGWTSKKVKETSDNIENLVYNKDAPGLTHLLENGHVISNQYKQACGTARAYPHINPAIDKAMQELERKVKEAIK